MRIAIIETGAPPPALLDRHPRYAPMMRRMLEPVAPGFSYSTWPMFETGEAPPLSAFDGLLLTGSPAGVYEEHGWIAPLEDLIRRAAEARRPQVGVCFGHQIMAQAFGGRVEKSDKGWGVGVHTYEVSGAAPWMTPRLGEIACALSHQDQVVGLPEDAAVLAGSDFCPNGVLSYARAPAISFQMHPEFSHDFARDLLMLRRARVGESLADEGLASLKGRSDRETMAKWIADFYRLA